MQEKPTARFQRGLRVLYDESVGQLDGFVRAGSNGLCENEMVPRKRGKPSELGGREEALTEAHQLGQTGKETVPRRQIAAHRPVDQRRPQVFQ